MKFCLICGEEIDTRDGENTCESCQREERNKARRPRARENRKARESALRDSGLVKVRGVMGGVYWE